MGWFERMFTLPKSMNSLGDALRDPVGAITGLAQLASYAAGIPGVNIPGWVSTVANIGAVYSQFRAAAEAERITSGMLSSMDASRRHLMHVIAALQAVPPPQPVAPRLERQMRANLQIALDQIRRSAMPGVDISGVLNLMTARGLGQIAQAYNQQAMQDVEFARQDTLRRMQMIAGLQSDLFSQQQAMYGLGMQRLQLLQQGTANAIMTLNELLKQRRWVNPLSPQAQMAQQASLMGAGAMMNVAGNPAVGQSLWQMARRGMR
jgi:hypothetical protein